MYAPAAVRRWAQSLNEDIKNIKQVEARRARSAQEARLPPTNDRTHPNAEQMIGVSDAKLTTVLISYHLHIHPG